MTDSSRRKFLTNLGQTAIVVGTASIVGDVFGTGNKQALAQGLSTPMPAGTPILVLIDLFGGNDILNTQVPINDPWYYDNTYGRGSLAIPANTALALPGSQYGLHPKLAWMAQRWTRGDVAFIQGIGENVKNEFSHFAAMEYKNTADFSYSEPLGWLGRYNDLAHAGVPVASISLNNLHRTLVGQATQMISVRDVQSFALTVDSKAAYGSKFSNSLSSMVDLNQQGNLKKASKMIEQTFSSSAEVRNSYNAAYNNGNSSGSLAAQLGMAAMMIAAGLQCQTYVAGMGGFDTHGAQAWQHGDLLSKLDIALQKFFAIIDASPRANDVFVLITSEFGRQITTNAGGGTDHGQASHGIVIGGKVRGGLYGEMPTLNPGGPTRPNRIFDAMRPTTDFRSMYATILNRLGGDSNMTAEVLKGNFADLGFFL
jgi:uncharacterized protein (DUF1501 family)